MSFGRPWSFPDDQNQTGTHQERQTTQRDLVHPPTTDKNIIGVPAINAVVPSVNITRAALARLSPDKQDCGDATTGRLSQDLALRR